MTARPAPATRAVPECHDDVCLTCSDAAVAVRVRELLADGLAVVDTDAGPQEVSVALVEAGPGDVVLVHAKEAIAVVEKRP
ncbi:HypC/HybG/HupF family hydrogenase formation chaperone [Micromonospora sp. DR5-3]|uniref:HypC/HybG/HupF family hydrogenase formation chaperone n=1 Tax=unclassified Micromonospora TaxID=2617518 RepID=UPI0011D65B49|nr:MULTISPECIES: HypC/HybG/HupF family hydrogenase formation chaperone [unclassified Micromonospora]MCW3818553.1 HypC/HybG/HupF family hydrogenase formation chaperone [Micromonospora sp. DR5-3]TYC20276.1 HypC/HybG/HupF family hydrogenase formation chaperone [Micromonospora sp. MP36]